MQKFNFNKIIIFFLILNFKINLLSKIQFFNSGKIVFKNCYNFILNSIKNKKKENEKENENIKNKNNFIKFNNFLNLSESEKIFFRNVNNKINLSLAETEYILKNNQYLMEIIKPSHLKVKGLFGLYFLNKIYENKDLMFLLKGFKNNILIPTFDLVIYPGFNLIKDIAFYPWKKDDLIFFAGLLSTEIISRKIFPFKNKNIFFNI